MLLPYSAQSPITKEIREFNDISDIWSEIRLIAELPKEDRTLGQDLWYLLPLFANPIYILDTQYVNIINEYYYVTEYNIPLSTSLDKADATKLEYFNIVKNELSVAINHKQKKKK